MFGAFLTTAGPEPRAVQSIGGEPDRAANHQALASPYYLAIPQDLHDPHIKQIDLRVSKNTRAARRPFASAARRPESQQIFKEHPHCPDILSLRQNRPTLASVSGRWSLLDGTSAIVVGSFCRNQPPQNFSSRRFSPASHAPALLLNPLLP